MKSKSPTSAHEPNWNGQGVWKELLLRPSRPIRRLLISAAGINFFMQASGNDAVIYCSPEVFKAAGIHSKKQLFGVNVIMGLAKSSFVFAFGTLPGQVWEEATFVDGLVRHGGVVVWVGPGL